MLYKVCTHKIQQNTKQRNITYNSISEAINNNTGYNTKNTDNTLILTTTDNNNNNNNINMQ